MKLIKKNLKIISIIIILILISYFIFIKINLIQNKKVNIELTTDNIINEETSISQPEMIEYQVDIKGAVKKPGVYKVPQDTIINDVISLAGGITKEADTSLINLSKKVEDEMVIIIYTKSEVKNSNVLNNVIKIVEKECICPNIQNDGCLNDEINETISNKETKVNINTATIEELTTLPGVGESKAKSIIEYRENNKFTKIEDILNVSGIGNSLYEQIKIYLTT